LSTLLHDLLEHLDASNVGQAAAQYCKDDSLNTEMFGVFIDTKGDLAAAQTALRTWNDAECLTGSWDGESTWKAAPISMVRGSDILIGPGLGKDESAAKRDLAKRATCKFTQAVAGDGCWAMADRCGISQDQLKQYNGGKSNFCNLIIKGDYYCCSSGNLPDFSPQPNADGTCKTHKITSTDVCDSIARANSMTVEQFQERNKNTWGWQGCQYLIPDQLLCISTGASPLPASDPHATCGPTVEGTTAPSDMSKINELNPCPLKACCNVWGNCGISKDFCILNPADTKAPGTTQPGANSCVASCGLEITNNGSPPAEFRRIGYFEAFNMERPCLHMLPGQIDTSFYTHLVSCVLYCPVITLADMFSTLPLAAYRRVTTCKWATCSPCSRTSKS
jgi:chitinase